MRDLLYRAAAVAATVPVVIGFTVLSAAILVGRGFLGLASRVVRLLDNGQLVPRHDASGGRDRARNAKEAARASGLLSSG